MLAVSRATDVADRAAYWWLVAAPEPISAAGLYDTLPCSGINIIHVLKN